MRPSYAFRIPVESDWNSQETDLDVQYLQRLVFGKSNDQIQEYFGENRSIERADEMLFAPRAVFQYYVQGFAKFMLSERARGDSDSASAFLGLLEARENRDQGSVKNIYSLLASCVDFIANNQTYFNASKEIYGDFNERAVGIRRVCDR